MKKISLLIMCFCLFSTFCLAYETDAPADNSNWGVQPMLPNAQEQGEIPDSEKVWEQERDEVIEENYGSEYSPAFSNRENINPNEADYGYGSTDGVE